MALISFVEHMKSNLLWPYKLALLVCEQYCIRNQIHSFIYSLPGVTWERADHTR